MTLGKVAFTHLPGIRQQYLRLGQGAGRLLSASRAQGRGADCRWEFD
jgi:hypothetical protein